MGKRRKRMTMKKYATKYALQRKTLGFDKEEKMIEIDMTTGEEINEEEIVQVVSNKSEEVSKSAPPWDAEPELQVVQIEEPSTETPPPVEARKATRKKTPRKTTAKKTTTRRRTAAKKAEE